MFPNKILRFICSCSHRVVVGIAEQVYSVLLLSFFFLEVKYIFVFFCCVRLSVYILILYSDEAVTGLFVLQFFKHIIPVYMLMIYNKLNVTLLSLYFLDDRHDTF